MRKYFVLFSIAITLAQINIPVKAVGCTANAAVEDSTSSNSSCGELVDRVVAVVEDKAIFESDLEMQIKQYIMQAQKKPTTDEEMQAVRKEVLDAMISDLLMSVHAEKEGIEVKDSELDAAVENAIKESEESLGGEAAFKEQIEREGLTMAKVRSMYRDRMKARMLIERLMYRDLFSSVEVTDREARAYYEEHIDEFPKRPATVNLAQILIAIKPSGEAKKKALKKIKEIEKKIRTGADFAEIAKKYSEGPSAKYGGNLGYVTLEDLNNPAFENAVKSLKVGEVSGPVLTEFGYHLIKLEDIKNGKYLVRHILVRVSGTDADRQRASQLSDSLRNATLNGADFAEAAEKFSDDYSSRDKGGVIGEVPLSNLPKELAGVLKNLKPGEVAPVIEDTKGFRIIKLLGVNPERPYTFEEAKEELKKLIRQQKLQDKYKDYIDRLKGLYYVDIKEG